MPNETLTQKAFPLTDLSTQFEFSDSLVSQHNKLVNTDPTFDKWQRHAQHVQINVGSNLVNIFHYHNTFDPSDGGYASEIAGMEKFRDYILARMGPQSLTQPGRVIALGDFNVLGNHVDTIMPDLVQRKTDWVDHVTGMAYFSNSGVYSTNPSLSDHDAVWAEFDLGAPSPDPLTWASMPTAGGAGEIRMEVASASDPYAVEYYFTNTTIANGSHDSGWQSSPVYIDTGLNDGTTYTYTVIARDKSSNTNTTSTLSGAALAAIDTITPPYLERFEQGHAKDWEQSTDDD